jgi:hypothetical protein
MTTARFAEDPHPPASDSELLNSAAEHLETRAKAVGDVSDDPAIFVAKARIHDAGVWREAAQEVRGLASSSGTPHSMETRINSAERAMLRYALELVDDRIASEPDEFAAVDRAAVKSLKRLAGEGAPSDG